MTQHPDLTTLIFGRLTWDAIPLHEPILLATFAAVVIGGIAIVAAITYFGVWGTLWRDWITSIDHKKIGIMSDVGGVAEVADRNVGPREFDAIFGRWMQPLVDLLARDAARADAVHGDALRRDLDREALCPCSSYATAFSFSPKRQRTKRD